MYDTIVIGGGPAGLTSAIFLRRANKKVLVLEANVCGGQIVTAKSIENYPGYINISGYEFAENIKNQALNLGAEIKYETVLRVDEDKKVYTTNNTYEAKSIIIAVGSKNRKLNITNEDKFTGFGISYCATCDGGFYKEKTVAVNGGGNSALHEALYLSSLAEKVFLIHRRDEFRGSADLVKKIKQKDNIELILNATIIGLNGDKKLQSITISRKDKTEELSLDGLFVSIGRIPKAKGLIEGLELAEGDYVKANESCITNIPGIFVAGDVRSKEIRQLVTATSDGAVAAEAALRYISA